MEQAFSIWSPVIMAQLKTPRRLGREHSYPSERFHRTLEDLKIKVKQSEILPQGQAVEVRVKVDILCLLEDDQGTMHLIKKEEIIKERVAYSDFDQTLERKDSLRFVINIKDISYDGELSRGEIRVRFLIEYNLIATREQVVRLWAGEQGELSRESLNQLFERLEEEVTRLAGENQELHRKVFYYQRDISSLKRSIGKLEKRNAGLLKEVTYHQHESEELRQNLQEKEARIYRLQHYSGAWSNPKLAETVEELPEAESGLGGRIKRLFLNNLL
ncbi:MAG: hypothetical protein WC109_05460 [Syntrophomonadaceae bacterium]|nr:hypothetical protein [Syntrophomonadaceae bacterium]